MAQLSGLARIGRDVEVRYTPAGDAVANLSLAFTYGKKDPNTGNRSTQWVEGSIWGNRAEAMAPHLTKGTQIYVVLDDARLEEFQKQDGSRSTKLTGRVSTIEFASRPNQQAQAAPPQQRTPQQAPPRQTARQPAPMSDNFADLEDDIPW